MRKAQIKRKTNETDIYMSLNLDGSSNKSINSGIGFLDHMLELFAFHSGIDLDLVCSGDLNVDDHHSVEDIGIVFGECILSALGDKRGINRYGNFYLPMDETLARATVDISGRSFLVFDAEFKSDRVGDLSTQMVEEFFRALAFSAKITLHINILYGKNDHHKVEAIFKAVARAIKEAIYVDENNMRVQSSKGLL